MDFVAVVDQAIALLRQRGRLTYRTLQLQFQLDDAHLEALKDELIEGQRLAADEAGRVLVWTGAPGVTVSTDAASAGIPTPAPLTYTPPYLAAKILTSKSALEGERKHVTVLFADLKGSMELLADRDPEEARQLLDPVLERMMAAVHRYEGTINQVMGDGIMALFGAPLAHEDHAVRACYAALAMQAAVKEYALEVQRRYGIPLQMRVGVNAGEVVVRAIGNDLHMDYSAIGQTTHLAARMEQMAMPGTILLTPAVMDLANGFIQVTSLGPVPIKGLDTPVEVFELVGATALRRRLQTAVARGLSPFVGRQPEVEALQQALARAGAGQGQVVALLGEPGVGKSRLVYEFLHSHRTQGWLRLESGAVSYGQATAYLPVCDLLKAYCHPARLLLLVNYRPEYQHGWGSKTYYTQLRLDPLPEASADTLLQALVGADAGLTPLTRLLIARTQGNPFFLEESVRTLVEIGVLVGDRGAYHLAQPLDTLQVPATVQAVLAARIDRLPPEDKRLLQTAAVIGTEVPWRLLQAIADTSDEALYHSLGQLQAAEFLYETSLFPAHAYTFKHALTHEVAYGSLLHERRRGLHARIVAALEALAGDRLDDQVERLAQHALQGEVWQKALAYGLRAGEKARTRPAYREAVVCFEQALAALEHLPDSRAATEQAIDLRLGLRAALNALGAAPGRLLDHLRHAETLAQRLGDQRRLGRVYADMVTHFWRAGDVERALVSGQRVLALAATLGHVGLQARAHLSLGQVYYDMGTIRGPSRVLSGMWRHSRGSCSMNALAPMAASRCPPGPI